jgi:hypothetical protein
VGVSGCEQWVRCLLWLTAVSMCVKTGAAAVQVQQARCGGQRYLPHVVGISPRRGRERATSRRLLPRLGGGGSSSLELAIRQGADGRWSSRPAGCAQPGDQRAGSFDGVDLAQSWGNLGRVVPARQTLANERRYCTQRSAGTKHRGSLHHLPRHVGAAPEVFGVRLLSPGYSFPSPGAKRPKLVQSAVRAPPR